MPLLTDRQTHIAQGQCNLEILTEALREFRIHIDHFEQIIAKDFMQITIGQGANIERRFARFRVQEWILAENIVLA